jgi:multiple sugar transport system substrate-binding protein
VQAAQAAFVSDYLAKHSRNYPYPPGFAEANQLISAALDPVWIGQQTAEQAITPDLIAEVNGALEKAKG